MVIKTKSKSEAEKIFNSIEIQPYEKYVDVKITYPNGYFGIFNQRHDDNSFIPFKFKYVNNANIIR